jgi:hypothetical protein
VRGVAAKYHLKKEFPCAEVSIYAHAGGQELEPAADSPTGKSVVASRWF